MKGITIPRTARGQTTFDRICHVAEQLFHTKGYHLTTIDDIVKTAGVSTGTFYLYFEDKYSLYRRLLLNYSHQIRSVIAIATENVEGRREKERVGIKTFIRYVRDNPQAYTIIWQSLQVDKALFVDYYSNFAEHYIKGLNEAEKNGELYPIDAITASYALMGISNFVGLQVTLFDTAHSTDEDIERIVDQVIRMLDRGLFVTKR